MLNGQKTVPTSGIEKGSSLMKQAQEVLQDWEWIVNQCINVLQEWFTIVLTWKVDEVICRTRVCSAFFCCLLSLGEFRAWLYITAGCMCVCVYVCIFLQLCIVIQFFPLL